MTNEKRVKVVGKRAERINDTSPVGKRIDPEEVRKALGAEKMTPKEVGAFLRRVHGTSDSSKGAQ